MNSVFGFNPVPRRFDREHRLPPAEFQTSCRVKDCVEAPHQAFSHPLTGMLNSGLMP